MNIFVTGATGYVGSAVVAELISAGHEVTGLARSDAAAASLMAAGARVHRGSLGDLDSLRAGAAASDGVIHTAFTNISATTDFAASCAADRAAIAALGAALAAGDAPDRPLVVTSGTGVLGSGETATEDATYDPANPVAALRGPSEDVALAFASRGVRASVLRLPPSVHSPGDKRGFIPDLIAIARSKGVAAYVGDGSNRWAAVHRSDAARLYRLAAEGAPAGSRLHAVGEGGVPFREIAEVIGRHLDLPVKGLTADEAQEHFGWLAAFAALDVPASSSATRHLLSWQPAGAGLLADLEAGHYFAS
jgi:nucleoside-diphosphate-sugar epimerase